MRLEDVNVSALMTREPVTVQKDEALATAARLMAEHGVRHLPVVQEGWIEGVLSHREVVASADDGELPVSFAMARPVITARPEQRALAVARVMRQRRIGCVPVVDDWGWLVGIVTATDFVRVAVKLLASRPRVVVGDVFRRDVEVRRPKLAPVAVDATSDLVDAGRAMLEHRVGAVPVVEGGVVVGALTAGDLLHAMLAGVVAPSPPRPADVPVHYYMSAPVRTVGPGDGVLVAAGLMRSHRISSVVVLEAGRAIGVLSRSDLFGARAQEDVPVSDCMTRHVIEIAPSASIPRACAQMLEREVHQLVVLEDGRPVGVLAGSDAVAAARDLHLLDPVSRWATATAFTVEVDQSARLVLALLNQADLGAVLVTDGRFPVGVFGRRERLLLDHADLDQPIEAFMSANLIVVPGDLPLHRAAAQMHASGAELAAVAGSGARHLVLSPTDIVRALAARVPASDRSRTPATAPDATDPTIRIRPPR